MNFSRASLGKDVEPAEARMLWVDKLGFDIRVVTGGNGKQKVLDVRLPFPAAATADTSLHPVGSPVVAAAASL